MEFKYNNNTLKMYFVVPVISIFILLYLSIETNTVFLYFVFIAISATFSFYKFYKKEKAAIFKLSDEEISYKNQKEIRQIKWSDVEKVEYSLQSDTKTIVITSKNMEHIEIGRKIENIGLLIRMIKAKVGSKFDTTEIPLEWKLDKK